MPREANEAANELVAIASKRQRSGCWLTARHARARREDVLAWSDAGYRAAEATIGQGGVIVVRSTMEMVACWTSYRVAKEEEVVDVNREEAEALRTNVQLVQALRGDVEQWKKLDRGLEPTAAERRRMASWLKAVAREQWACDDVELEARGDCASDSPRLGPLAGSKRRRQERVGSRGAPGRPNSNSRVG